jgi:hypothetical protein
MSTPVIEFRHRYVCHGPVDKLHLHRGRPCPDCRLRPSEEAEQAAFDEHQNSTVSQMKYLLSHLAALAVHVGATEPQTLMAGTHITLSFRALGVSDKQLEQAVME